MRPDKDKTDRRIAAPGASAVSGVDLIGGPIMKNLLIFMLPILLSYVFQQLYNAVDTAIVGHYLGEQSLAAVGANVAIFDLMVMFAQSLGNGLCIVVSRAYCWAWARFCGFWGRRKQFTGKHWRTFGSSVVGSRSCLVTIFCHRSCARSAIPRCLWFFLSFHRS